MELLIFDISGEFAHFRKFNTTSSPLTYTIPSRTSLAGLLGAIAGIGREEYYEHFLKEKAFIAIQVLNRIKKQGYGFNLINTKEGMYRIKNRTQVRFEFVVNPSYRIFFGHTDENLYSDLKKRIKGKDFFFQPYLGLSQLTADVNYVDSVDSVSEDATGPVEIITAVNLKSCTGSKIEIDPDLKYSSSIMPMEISLDLTDPLNRKNTSSALPKNRKTNEYAEVIYEVTGKPVKVFVNSYNKVPGYGNILFL